MASEISSFMREALDGRREPPPSARALGHTGFLELEPGRARSRFVAREEFRTPFGVTHGGFLAAMLDDVMGQAVATVLAPDASCASVTLSVSFLEPVLPGTALVGEGRVVRRGRAVLHVEGSLSLETGAPVARGTSAFVLLPLPDPARSRGASR